MNLSKSLVTMICGLMWGCGGSSGDSTQHSPPVAPRTVTALPDPCEWLDTEEAQVLLGLSASLERMPMGNDESPGRSCVYKNDELSSWFNVSYQGINPLVYDTQGKSSHELIQLASQLYAHGLDHEFTGKVDGHPTLAFSDGEQTIMIVFTDIGKARDLPEGIPAGHSISSYYTVTLLIRNASQSREARLEALLSLVDRPVALLLAAAGE